MGRPIDALPDVRCAVARSAGIDRPDGVTLVLQVSRYKVEPSERVSARNLLSHDDSGAKRSEEPEHLRPEVPVVGESAGPSRRRERLARAGSGPAGAVVGPPGPTHGRRPDPDPREEMNLAMIPQLVRLHEPDVPLDDVPGRDVPGGDEVAQPLRGVRVDLDIAGPRLHPTYLLSRRISSASSTASDLLSLSDPTWM